MLFKNKHKGLIESACSALLWKDHARRKALAMRNERYAEIEARRFCENGNSVFMSEELELGWTEWNEQQVILEAIPSRAWVTLARFGTQRPLKRAKSNARHAAQRVTRGWDDKALWSLDHHLCATLAQQLRALADTANGWPAHEFDSFEDWQLALRSRADSLAGYASRDEGPAQRAWLDALDSGDVHGADAFREAALAEERAAIEAAKGAMHWVADHLETLWD